MNESYHIFYWIHIRIHQASFMNQSSSLLVMQARNWVGYPGLYTVEKLRNLLSAGFSFWQVNKVQCALYMVERPNLSNIRSDGFAISFKIVVLNVFVIFPSIVESSAKIHKCISKEFQSCVVCVPGSHESAGVHNI